MGRVSDFQWIEVSKFGVGVRKGITIESFTLERETLPTVFSSKYRK